MQILFYRLAVTIPFPFVHSTSDKKILEDEDENSGEAIIRDCNVDSEICTLMVKVLPLCSLFDKQFASDAPPSIDPSSRAVVMQP